MEAWQLSACAAALLICVALSLYAFRASALRQKLHLLDPEGPKQRNFRYTRLPSCA